jgi:hypothetical protein
LEEEEEALAEAAAGEYRDLEDGRGGKDGANGDEAAGSAGLRRPEGALVAACVVAYFLSCLGVYYLVLGSFYLPPEAGPADGGRLIANVGRVILAVAGPVLACSFTVCCCCRSPRGSAAPGAVSG